MNVLTSETLPERAFVPLKSPLDPYHDVFWKVQDEPDFGLTPNTRSMTG